MSGYTAEEVIGKRFDEIGLIAVKDLKTTLDKFRQSMSGAKNTPYEIEIISKSGDKLQVEVSSSPLVTDGRIAGEIVILRDVSERKKILAAIEAERLTFETLARNIPGVVYRLYLRKKGDMRFYNDMLFELSGYRPEELKHGIVCSIDPLILPQDRPGVIAQVSQAVAASKDFEIGYRIKRKDGIIRHFLERGKPVLAADLKPLYIDGVIFDVTERRNAENAVSEEKAKLSQYLDLAGEILIVLDSQGRVVRINKKTGQVFGYSEDEMLGKDWFLNFLPKNIAAEVKKVYQKIMNGEIKQVETAENLVVTKSGIERLILWHNAAILDAGGKIAGTISFGEDVTEARINEAKIKESEIRYRRLFETAQDAILILDSKTGKILNANPYVEKLLEYEPGELLGKQVWEISPLKDLIANREKLAALQLKRYVKYDNLPLLTKTGRPVAVEFVSNVYEVDHQVVMQCSIRDITARVNLQKTFQSQYDLLIHLNEARSVKEVPILLARSFTSMPDIDGFGVYLADKTSGALDLIYSHGLSEGFVKSVAHLPADTAQTKLVMKGQVVYQAYNDLPFAIPDIRRREKIRAIAVIPLVYQKAVVGCINIVSRHLDDFSPWLRLFFENIAAQIAVALSLLLEKEAVAESRERLEIIFENAPDAILLHDLKGSFIDANKTAERLLGYAKTEFSGKNFNSLKMVAKKDLVKLAAMLAQLAVGKKAGPYEFSLVRKNGTSVDLEIISYPVKISGKSLALAIGRDVSVRKKEEEKLRQSEGRYRSLFESSKDIMVQIDRQGTIVDINRAIAAYGFDKQEFIGRKVFSLLKVFSKKSLVAITEAYAKRMAGLELTPYVIEAKDKNGVNHFGEVTSVSLKDDAGSVFGALVVLHDVTERENSRLALEKSEKVFRDLYETISTLSGATNEVLTAICKKTKEIFGGYFVLVNYVQGDQFNFRAGCGLPSQISLGGNEPIKGAICSHVLEVKKLFFTNDLAREKCAHCGLPLSQDPAVKAYGLNTYLGVPLIFSDGSVRGTLCVLFKEKIPPFTRQEVEIFSLLAKRAAIELEAEEVRKVMAENAERMAILFEKAPDAIYLMDLQGNLVDGNKAAEMLIGYKKGEAIGKSFVTLGLLPVSQIPKAAALLAKNALGQSTGPDELTLIRKDRSKVVVDIRTYPIELKSRKLIIGVARDVTERQLIMDEVKASELRYRQLFESTKDILLIIDSSGKIIGTNRKEAFGYRDKDLLATNISDLGKLMSEADFAALLAHFKKRAAGEDAGTYQIAFPAKSGAPMAFEVDGISLRDAEGKVEGVLVILHDITENKKFQQSLEEKVTELKRMNDLMVGREMKMMELKEKIKQLEEQLKSR